MTGRLRWLCVLLLVARAATARAHVGSPDVYADGQAGPYHLSIVIRPPLVIPGVADIEVRTDTAGVNRIAITPIPLTGEAAYHPPVADAMQRPSRDAQFFTGHLWIMATGSWQIRFVVTGAQGQGVLSIPFPATAIATRKMQYGLGTMLAAVGILLVLGMIGIVGAATREANLAPGAAVVPAGWRQGSIAMVITAAVLVTGVLLGNVWWKSEAATYSSHVYKPLQMTATLDAGNVLDLKLRDPGWISQRKLDDFIPDHDHLMHLYMIRWPRMNVAFHLHPQPIATGEFQVPLPSVQAGNYRLYADVVHAMGFPETIVGSVTLPTIAGSAILGDDAEAMAPPVAEGDSAVGPASVAESSGAKKFSLPDGYTMVWSDPGKLVPNRLVDFDFELLDRAGHPASDVALYMGMLGHAAFVKTDGTVFAHIHPNGTVAMAAFMMANPGSTKPGAGGAPTTDMSDMPGMSMSNGALPATVRFPYGFPSAGRYRIFVQMKHGNTVETGVFDTDVESAPQHKR